MFDVAPTELLLVAVVALVVIGPKDLPKAMRFVGYWVGRARGVARQFRAGFDTMVREAELQEMEKKWAEENARIMREHPVAPAIGHDPAALAVTDSPAVTDPAVTDPAPTDDAPPVMVEQPVVVPAAESVPAPIAAGVSSPATDIVPAPTPRKPRPRKTAPKAES